LRDLQRTLSVQANRRVEFMAYRTAEKAMADKPSIAMLP
jgi:hypothetical protein